MKLLGAVLSLCLMSCTTAHAWSIKGQPAGTVDRLVNESEALPDCAFVAISKRLKTVYVRPMDLGNIYDHRIDGMSWPSSGITVMDSRVDGLDNAYVHELGHWYDWTERVSKRPSFRTALKADFAAMTPAQFDSQNYLQDPQEAFAELFAWHFRGQAYFEHDHYRPDLFPQTRAELVRQICQDRQ